MLYLRLESFTSSHDFKNILSIFYYCKGNGNKKNHHISGRFHYLHRFWRPLGESNSCCKDENLESWATRRRGHAIKIYNIIYRHSRVKKRFKIFCRFCSTLPQINLSPRLRGAACGRPSIPGRTCRWSCRRCHVRE